MHEAEAGRKATCLPLRFVPFGVTTQHVLQRLPHGICHDCCARTYTPQSRLEARCWLARPACDARRRASQAQHLPRAREGRPAEAGSTWYRHRRPLERCLTALRQRPRAPPALRSAAFAGWARRWCGALSAAAQLAAASAALAGRSQPGPSSGGPAELDRVLGSARSNDVFAATKIKLERPRGKVRADSLPALSRRDDAVAPATADELAEDIPGHLVVWLRSEGAARLFSDSGFDLPEWPTPFNRTNALHED